MLEILIIVLLAVWLYNLAKAFNKPNKWLYPIIAVITYIVSGVFCALLAMFLFSLAGSSILESMSTSVIGICAIPFAAGGVWVLHFLLKKAWSKEKAKQENEDQLLDANDGF